MLDSKPNRSRSFYFVLATVLICTASVAGQRRGATPPAPAPLDDKALTNDRFESIRREPEIRENADQIRLKLRRDLEPLYRKPTKAESELVAVAPEDLEKFKDLLKKPKTGIVKLMPDAGCPDSIPVVSAVGDCLKYTMPGNGSSYSFRIKNYRISRLSDLTLQANRFATKGFMTQGILVDIGDVRLESVSLMTAGVPYLKSFQPATEVQQAAKIDNDFLKGVQDGDFLYKRTAPVKENSTILLRSVAYKGNSMRSHQTLTYDEFEFDERSDVIVAFRVIRRDADGAVTIVWREIEEKKSPMMTAPGK